MCCLSGNSKPRRLASLRVTSQTFFRMFVLDVSAYSSFVKIGFSGRQIVSAVFLESLPDNILGWLR